MAKESDFLEGPKFLAVCGDTCKNQMFVSIDSAIRGKSSGGIRVLPDVEKKEVIALSKTMTLKYGFLGLPIGGAKSGVKTKFPPGTAKRERLMKTFGRKLAPVLSSKAYIPGFDIGTQISDLASIFSGAGLPFAQNNWRPVTHVYTAWGLVASAMEALNLTNDSINGKTVSIEGFGKVGSEFAFEAEKKGAIITGVSTIKGALVSSRGFDINELRSSFETYGDDFVRKIKGGKKISPKKLLSYNNDIFAPCARLNPINGKNFSSVKAKIIISGHNMPINDTAASGFQKKGIIYLPGFMANSGGVLGSQLSEYFNDTEIKEIIFSTFAQKIKDTLKHANDKGVSVGEFGKIIAEKNFSLVKENEEQKTIFKRGFTFGVGQMPKEVGKLFVQKRLKRLEFS